jgi:hypothetical protein
MKILAVKPMKLTALFLEYSHHIPPFVISRKLEYRDMGALETQLMTFSVVF